MTTNVTTRKGRLVPCTALDGSALPSAAGNADIPWRAVAAALAQESPLLLSACVRNFAKGSRAHGDTVQAVVKILEDLLRDAAPESTTLAKRSSEVAAWAIEAYFEEPVPTQVATWRAESIPPQSACSSRKSRPA